MTSATLKLALAAFAAFTIASCDNNTEPPAPMPPPSVETPAPTAEPTAEMPAPAPTTETPSAETPATDAPATPSPLTEAPPAATPSPQVTMPEPAPQADTTTPSDAGATPPAAGTETPEPVPGTPAAATGQMCGGIAAIQCGEGEYCSIPEGQCVSVADVAGTCAPKPAACTKEYMPVCGCDGKTYGNACDAAAAGVSIASRGECAPPG